MKKTLLILTLLLPLGASSCACGGNQTAGTVAGAVIGHQSRRGPEGALVGTAAGMLADLFVCTRRSGPR